MKNLKVLVVILLLFPLKFYGQCFSFTLTVVPPTCLGCCDGSVTVNNLTGGCPPYMYTWSPGFSGPYIPEICFDTTFTLTIIDFGSCCPDTTIECRINSTTGTNNNLTSNATSFSFFPNPFNDYATFEIHNRISNAEYSVDIYNMLGNCVKSIQNITENSLMISSKELRSGIYTFKVIQNKEVAGTGKIIVE
jgi:hypothetical protein